MAWERRSGGLFYYRGRRIAGKVLKTYLGRGTAAQAAALADERRRAERQAERVAWLCEVARVEQARMLSEEHKSQCQLLAEAILLAGGCHRHKRSSWRRWHEARRANEVCRASRRYRVARVGGEGEGG